MPQSRAGGVDFRRGLVIPAAVITLFWIVLFAPQILMHQTFVLGDAPIYRPFAEFSRTQWQEHGTRTFWNPYVHLGIPSSSSLADARPQYLPDVLLDLHENVRPNRWHPLAVPLLAHLAGMLAMAALARRFWKAGAAAAVAAAVTWGLMPGLLVPLTKGHTAQFTSAALIPVALLAVHLAVSGSLRIRWWSALILSLVLGMQCLTGHPQFVVYTWILVVLLAAVEVRRTKQPSRLLLVSGALILAVGIAAAMWWPALLYSRHTFRGDGAVGVPLAEVTTYSFAFRDLATLIWPRAVGFGGEPYWGGLGGTRYSPYLGLVAVTLAVWTWRGRTRRPSARTWLLWLVTIGAVILALGTSLGPVYGFLHHNIPFWSRFRIPFYGLIAAQVGLALLVARAVATTAVPDAPNLSPRRRAMAFAAGGLALLLSLGLITGLFADAYAAWAQKMRPNMSFEVAHRAAVAAGWDLVLRGLVAGAGLVLLLRSRRGPRAAALASWAVVIFVAVDLGSVTVQFLRDGTGPVTFVEAPPPPPVAVAGAADPTARVVSMRRKPVTDGRHAPYQGIYTNHWISWRARSLNGIHGALPRYWDPVLRNGLTRYYQVLRAYGVRYYATDPGTRLDDVIFEPFTRSADAWVYRLRDSLGRFYTVPRVEAVGGDQKTAEEMASPRFDPTAVAYGPPAAAGSYPGSAGCRLRVVTDQPDRIVLATESSDPAFVVVADAFFPGWEARLDGEIVPIHRVNLLLRGLAVPAGGHELELAFVPEGWRSAQLVTRTSLAVWLAMLVVVAAISWRARRRAASP